MPKPITPDVVVAYSLCPRKAYLLLCTEEHGTSHEYQRIVAADQHRNQESFLNFNGLTAWRQPGPSWNTFPSQPWAPLGHGPPDA